MCLSELAESGLFLQGISWAPLLHKVGPAQPSSSLQFTTGGREWGVGTGISSSVFLLEPRPGAVVFWKAHLGLHHHFVNSRQDERMSWNPFTVARIFISNTDHAADTKVQALGSCISLPVEGAVKPMAKVMNRSGTRNQFTLIPSTPT